MIAAAEYASAVADVDSVDKPFLRRLASILA